jgi:hypothetical protein
MSQVRDVYLHEQERLLGLLKVARLRQRNAIVVVEVVVVVHVRLDGIQIDVDVLELLQLGESAREREGTEERARKRESESQTCVRIDLFTARIAYSTPPQTPQQRSKLISSPRFSSPLFPSLPLSYQEEARRHALSPRYRVALARRRPDKLEELLRHLQVLPRTCLLPHRSVHDAL